MTALSDLFLDVPRDNRFEIRTHLNLCDRINLQRVCKTLAREDAERIPLDQWYSPWFRKTFDTSKEWRALLNCFVRSDLHLGVKPDSFKTKCGKHDYSIMLVHYSTDVNNVLFEYVILRYTLDAIAADRYDGTATDKFEKHHPGPDPRPPIACTSPWPVSVSLKTHHFKGTEVFDVRVTRWDYRDALKRRDELIRSKVCHV
jgi:hypothetical protein